MKNNVNFVKHASEVQWKRQWQVGVSEETVLLHANVSDVA
jgi:hypothetical protein